MSTNKTQNYQLHAWEPGDDFLLSEFNANFAAIDGLLSGLPANKKLKIVTGSYLGTETNPQTIVLGFQPKAVYLASRISATQQTSLCLSDVRSMDAAIVKNGFTISSVLNVPPDSDYPHNGASMNPYRYIAFDWED